jgi:hypothetical protein
VRRKTRLQSKGAGLYQYRALFPESQGEPSERRLAFSYLRQHPKANLRGGEKEKRRGFALLISPRQNPFISASIPNLLIVVRAHFPEPSPNIAGGSIFMGLKSPEMKVY